VSTRPWDWNLCSNTLTFHLNQKAEEDTYNCNKQRPGHQQVLSVAHDDEQDKD
jgi:hypothetical protein